MKRKQKMTGIGKLLVGLAFSFMAFSYGSFGVLTYRYCNVPYDSKSNVVSEYRSTKESIGALELSRLDAEGDSERRKNIDGAINALQTRYNELKIEPDVSASEEFHERNAELISYGAVGLLGGTLAISPFLLKSSRREDYDIVNEDERRGEDDNTSSRI